MKIQPTFLKGLALLILFPATLAYAQEYSLNDAISGSAIPLTIKPADIPEGFKVEAMAVIGKPGRAEDLPEKLQQRETPSDRRKLNETVFEGPYRPA